jgi:DNA modification methylase
MIASSDRLDRTPRRRTPLSAPSLSFQREGEPDAAERLRRALAVPPLPESVRPEDRQLFEATLCTQLFHSFAGRTHPLLVRQLLADVALPAGASVLDPFVGSGTVLVEAALHGARGIGCDINPLAVRLCRFKATPLPGPMQKALYERAAAVASASLERVKAKEPPGRVWDTAKYYPPHVFLELCGLRQEIESVVQADPPLGEALLLIFSSLIIKASEQRAETRVDRVDRRIGRGQVTRWFLAKAEEVVRLHAALFSRISALPAPPPAPLCLTGDARALLRVTGQPLWAGSIHCVITSPPYLGTYDYAGHHARRFAWLDIDPQPVIRGEMAARRHGAHLPLRRLVEQHQRDTNAWVAAIAKLLRPGGRLFVLVGDSVVGSQPVRGDTPIRTAAEHSGLRFVARSAAERPNYYRPAAAEQAPRLEHLLEFEQPSR